MGGGRFLVGVGMVAVVLVLAAVSYVFRTVIVLSTRHRWPAVADAADKWWRWAPLVVICAVGIRLFPVIGIPLTIGVGVALTRPDALGSPFRPR